MFEYDILYKLLLHPLVFRNVCVGRMKRGKKKQIIAWLFIRSSIVNVNCRGGVQSTGFRFSAMSCQKQLLFLKHVPDVTRKYQYTKPASIWLPHSLASIINATLPPSHFTSLSHFLTQHTLRKTFWLCKVRISVKWVMRLSQRRWKITSTLVCRTILFWEKKFNVSN
jgi:hypothetical protein